MRAAGAELEERGSEDVHPILLHEEGGVGVGRNGGHGLDIEGGLETDGLVLLAVVVEGLLRDAGVLVKEIQVRLLGGAVSGVLSEATVRGLARLHDGAVGDVVELLVGGGGVDGEAAGGVDAKDAGVRVRGELVDALDEHDRVAQVAGHGGLANVADDGLASLAVAEGGHAGVEELLNGAHGGLHGDDLTEHAGLDACDRVKPVKDGSNDGIARRGHGSDLLEGEPLLVVGAIGVRHVPEDRLELVTVSGGETNSKGHAGIAISTGKALPGGRVLHPLVEIGAHSKA